MNVHICQRCGTKFERRTNGNEYKFCSHACASSSPRKYSVEVLEMLAVQGLTTKEIGERLGFKDPMNSVRKALRKHDLHRVWSLARYKKCQPA